MHHTPAKPSTEADLNPSEKKSSQRHEQADSCSPLAWVQELIELAERMNHDLDIRKRCTFSLTEAVLINQALCRSSEGVLRDSLPCA